MREIVLSVVLPVYRCAPCLSELFRRLETVLSSLTDSFEVICVEDGGRDSTWETLEQLAIGRKFLRTRRHLKNLGQHAAIATGLSMAKGQFTCVMDADLQHPPELLPLFLEKIAAGADVVFGVRQGRQDARWRRAASWMRWLPSKLGAALPIAGTLGCFVVMTAEMRGRFLSSPGAGRLTLAVLRKLCEHAAYVPYRESARYAGRSSYTAGKLLKLAATAALFAIEWKRFERARKNERRRGLP